MPVPAGEPKPEYTHDEKTAIVEKVCLMYESQHCTLESACAAAGVSVRSFLLWRTQFTDFADRFKKAKLAQQADYWETLIQPLADTALQRLLKGEKATDKKTKGERQVTRNEAGELIESFAITEQTVTEKEILPNPTVVIFANKGLYPERFVDHSKVEQEVTVKDQSLFMQLPLDKRLAILEIINAGNQQLPDGTKSDD